MLRNGGFRNDAIRFGSVAASQLLADPRGVLVGGRAMQHAPDVPDKPSTGLDRGRVASAAGADQSDEAAERRARFEESLSAEDRALLEELERRRLAYVEGVDVADIVDAAPNNAPADALHEATPEAEHIGVQEVIAAKTTDIELGASARKSALAEDTLT